MELSCCSSLDQTYMLRVEARLIDLLLCVVVFFFFISAAHTTQNKKEFKKSGDHWACYRSGSTTRQF